MNLIDTAVFTGEHYETSEPQQVQDLYDMINDVGSEFGGLFRASAPVFLFAMAQRERVNTFVEGMNGLAGYGGFDTDNPPAALLFNVDFTFDVDLFDENDNDAHDEDYGLAWDMEEDIDSHFSSLRSAVFSINFANDLTGHVGNASQPSDDYKKVQD